MLTKTNKIVCDDCGRFVSYADLASGKARHVMDTPDAYGYAETFESQCARCRTPQGDAVGQQD